MDVGKSEMKGKLEKATNLTCYHLNINKLINLVEAEKKFFTVTRPILSKTPGK